MNKEVKEFLDSVLLCAVGIGVVFHLNSFFSNSASSEKKQESRTALVNPSDTIASKTKNVYDSIRAQIIVPNNKIR